MENIVILAEWHGNSWGGSNIMIILLGQRWYLLLVVIQHFCSQTKNLILFS